MKKIRIYEKARRLVKRKKNKEIKTLTENDLRNISSQCELSEEFIREFQNKVDWDYISGYQKLSEGFIREFQDKIDLYNICQHQKLSEEFVLEFKDRINFNELISCFYSKKFQSEIISSWRYKRL